MVYFISVVHRSLRDFPSDTLTELATNDPAQMLLLVRKVDILYCGGNGNENFWDPPQQCRLLKKTLDHSTYFFQILTPHIMSKLTLRTNPPEFLPLIDHQNLFIRMVGPTTQERWRWGWLKAFTQRYVGRCRWFPPRSSAGAPQMESSPEKNSKSMRSVCSIFPFLVLVIPHRPFTIIDPLPSDRSSCPNPSRPFQLIPFFLLNFENFRGWIL